MESIFNLNNQNSNLDNKIVAGLDRISQVFKTLLWGKSKTYNLSPIQIQLLIFIEYHSEEKTTISYLHNIEVPNNIYLTKNEIKKDKKDNFYLLLNKHNLFIGKSYHFKKL